MQPKPTGRKAALQNVLKTEMYVVSLNFNLHKTIELHFITSLVLFYQCWSQGVETSACSCDPPSFQSLHLQVVMDELSCLSPGPACLYLRLTFDPSIN